MQASWLFDGEKQNENALTAAAKTDKIRMKLENSVFFCHENRMAEKRKERTMPFLKRFGAIKPKWKNALRALLFCFALFIVFDHFQGIFVVDAARGTTNIRNYYKERPDSLDAVYLGGSNVHAFWQPVFGWDEYGIAVWNFSMDSMPHDAIKYYLIEARKKQPNALYLINLNVFKTNGKAPTDSAIHWAADFLPLSLNKIRMLFDITGDMEDPSEFFFPIIRFHSRWDSLKPLALGASDVDYKSSIQYSPFISKSEDQSSKYNIYEEKSEVPQTVLNVFYELLEYIDANHVNVLFLEVPQVLSKQEGQRINTLEAILKERGYPCLDLMDETFEIGLNPQTDFYNTLHTNVHGSIKFSDYLGRYLVENYHFSDKRGQAGWESWDKAAEGYMKYLSPWTLPFERAYAKRSDLDIPKLNNLKISGCDITVTWKEAKGADGYQIYRKSNSENGGYWHLIATVDMQTLSFEDKGLRASEQYTYTVVPFLADEENDFLYGSFNVLGVSGKTGGSK
ncbi:MAG: fibronectin type III domain-containing protein [Clostridia bacterium]|nr:fibronectin type III domain-containing protein [Clostridia bacterium]